MHASIGAVCGNLDFKTTPYCYPGAGSVSASGGGGSSPRAYRHSSDVEAPKEEPGEAVPVPTPPTIRRSDIPSSIPQEFPANWLARLEYLQKGLQDVQYRIGGVPQEERQGVPFTELVMAHDLPMNCWTPAIAEYDGTTDPVEHLASFENAALLHRYTDGIKCCVFFTTFARAAQTWFNQLSAGAIGSFQEFRSLFLHQFAISRKLRKTELSLSAVRQKDNETLKEYLQRFNTAALEVPSATQEVKASVFSQGLLDGDFFKSLAKKPVSKFNALLARTAKYINMKDAQAAKKESRGEKRKDSKEETQSKKPRTDSRERKAPYQRINTVYTPLTVPITQALMAIEGKGLLARPRSWRDGPQRPQSDKFYRFHNDYGHTTEECRHLMNEIERLIQNVYLQEYVCWEKARGTGPYQKKETDRTKEPRGANQEAPARESPQAGMKEKMDPNNVPRKGIIRMITGGPVGDDSHHARNAEIRRAHSEAITKILDVEATEDTPIIQFGRAERSGPRSTHNDALVITALLANYEVERIFIDSESSADILFGKAFDQMQLGDAPLEEAVISMYHMKIKFSTPGGVGEVQGDPVQSRRCYVEAVRKGQKRGPNELLEEPPQEKRSREGDIEEDLDTNQGSPPRVQPVEELLSIELDLEGIDPEVISHHLNIDPHVKSVKQKKRHFGPEKDKIIQAEIDKLVAAGHVEEIQYPEWLSNVVLVPKPGGKWRMCIDFRDLNKACPKDFYSLPRIDQLVDSTSGCELLSMMDASQGYHQIMLAPEDRKRVSFITSAGILLYGYAIRIKKCRSYISMSGGQNLSSSDWAKHGSLHRRHVGEEQESPRSH
ncbi:UNVERIFIED_CONTAM: hypothetical protein Slati_0931500 [Sesamum latifolium]|uniref:Retrotransposon gag domain-containing protein n=1 Tax=Sesamum latifolium TaxID=2727402 RepID=A0AAW2XP48_9LAMI